MQISTTMRVVAATLVLGACSSSSSGGDSAATTTAASDTTTTPTVATTELSKSVADHLMNVHKMEGIVVVQDADGKVVISTQTAAGNTGDGVLTCNNAMMVAGNVDMIVKAADASVLAHRDKGGDCTAGA